MRPGHRATGGLELEAVLAPLDESALEVGPDGQLTEASWQKVAEHARAGEPEAMGLHGVRRMMLGDSADALAWLTRADQAGASNAPYNLGACHEMRGDHASAEKVRSRAAEAGDADAMLGLVRLRLAAGDKDGGDALVRSDHRGR
jgi:hypothetical protein